MPVHGVVAVARHPPQRIDDRSNAVARVVGIMCDIAVRVARRGGLAGQGVGRGGRAEHGAADRLFGLKELAIRVIAEGRDKPVEGRRRAQAAGGVIAARRDVAPGVGDGDDVTQPAIAVRR